MNNNKNFVAVILIIVTSLILSAAYVSAQSVGVYTNNPDSSSAFDIVSARKGLLIPRINLTDINIASPITGGVGGPAQSLLIFNTNSAVTGGSGIGYYYWQNNKWNKLSTTLDEPWFSITTNSGAIANTDSVYIMGRAMVGTNTPATVASSTSGSTPEKQRAAFTVSNGDASVNGITIGLGGGSVSSNTAIGKGALYNNAAGSNLNTAVGQNSLNLNTTGNFNTALGTGSSLKNTTGHNNTALGTQALTDNVNGSNNIAVGYNAATGLTGGHHNIVIGNNITVTALSGSGQLNIANCIFGIAIDQPSAGAGNIGIGATDPKAKLDVSNLFSSSQPALRLRTPFSGSNTDSILTWNSADSTVRMVAPSVINNSWQLTGNTGTNSGTNFLGTNDNVSLRVKTNNQERVVVDSNGNVGIGLNTLGLAAPKTRLQVDNSSVLFGSDITGDGNRMYWNYGKGAFRVGTLNSSAAMWDDANTGQNSVGMGYNALASGVSSTSIGYGNQALGDYSVSMGIGNKAADISVVLGNANEVNGWSSGAIGASNKVGVIGGTSVNNSFAAGYGNNINPDASNSVALGNQNIISGQGNSTVMGFNNNASGNSSVAIGYQTKSSGLASVSMGIGTESSAQYSFASGNATQAQGDAAVAMGWGSKALGLASFSSGFTCESNNSYSVSMGNTCKAQADAAVSIGLNNTASGDASFAVGASNNVSGGYSVVIGNNNTASGYTTVAIGEQNTSSGQYSITFGADNSATQYGSIAMGLYSQSLNAGSVVMGDASSSTLYASSSADNQFTGMFSGGYRFLTNRNDVSKGLFVDNAGNVTTSGTVNGVSDIRLKKDIQPLSGVLGNLNQIRGVTYYWKDSLNKKQQIGMIAQELEKIYPQLITTNKATGYKAINYSQFTAILLEGIKEQQIKIDNQQIRIENQEKKINILTEELQKLKEVVEELKK